MKPIGVETSRISILPEFRTRKGEPKPAKVRRILESMVRRHEANLPPQIQAGVVRPADKEDQYYLVAGEHRMVALGEFNKMMVKAGEEPVLFYVVVEHSKSDLEAVETGVMENSTQTQLSIFDRAAGMSLLQEKGCKLEEIAKLYDLKSTGGVSDTIAVGKLPKKIQALVEKGELTEEGAIVLARYNKDAELQEELLKLATQTRDAMIAIEERAKAKSTAGEAKSKEGEEEPTTEPTTAKKKVPAKRAPVAAKHVKEAVGAKNVGKKKGKKDSKPRTKSYPAFYNFLEATVAKDEKATEPMKDLAGKLEGWFENEYTDQQLLNAFTKCCRDRYPQAKSA